MPRYLTKSRYLLGLNCPTKLYYTGKSDYPDKNEDNDFLKALAEGGYQVGALAKCYYPTGIEIENRDYDSSVRETYKHLKQPRVVLFEAAFMWHNLFIRADIIEKKDRVINIFEVKAKSFGGTDSADMLTPEGYINTAWLDYLYDVAYQKYVISKMYPEYLVRAHLMLANKNAPATENGLNQKFQLRKIEGDRTYVDVIGVESISDLGDEILIRVNVDDLVELIWNGKETKAEQPLTYEETIKLLAEAYENDSKIATPINKNCQDCEYRIPDESITEGKLSGFRECWKTQLGWSDRNFGTPLIFELWNYRSKQALIDDSIYYLKDISKDRFKKAIPKEDGSLSNEERQWLQIEKVINSDPTPYIDIEGLKGAYNKFKFPLHFIDFETTTVAIPFYKGRKPYEQVAFQFSHHSVTSDLKIEHTGEYICKEKGKFPNFDFVRQLKDQLGKDDGTIFRYAAHENTVLNQILVQLNDAPKEEIKDKQELIDFIVTITQKSGHKGHRNMVDLKDLVQKYYYHPQTRGSNSLKAVLPAVLSSSMFLQEKYSQPIYGRNSMIRSKNYPDGWIWIKKDSNGEVINPYKLIPPLYDGIEETIKKNFLMKGDIREGGAAMTAFGLMQFANISDFERESIAQGLLKYCELDTMAMVLIWECWHNLINVN